MTRPLAIGIDVGTSGVRALAIDDDGAVRAQAQCPMPAPLGSHGRLEQAPAIWWLTLHATLAAVARAIPAGFAARTLALDGTSGTLLLSDRKGEPLGPALMYADQRAQAEATRIADTAPAESGAHGASSALAKLLWLLRERPPAIPFRVLHQADWLLARLGAPLGTSDENNALKLGYDPVARAWPAWLTQLGVPAGSLPRVHAPGTPVGTLSPALARALGLPAGIALVAGTTDGVAAFLATGASAPGEAVTSLGSTLVLKLLCQQPVFQPASGIYSHRLGELWLAGGASNSGGAVLRAFFADDEIARCSKALQPTKPTGLDYYPLLHPGERFPIADPALPPRLTPRPDDSCRFFQGILEGMAEIERLGYARLQAAGGERLLSVRSIGGGALNAGWTRIRADRLGVPLLPPAHQAAAYGAALLALRARQS
ncbi:FGGY-family carbohydrate kinase [Acidihalobacter prosperus]|uniref:Carbohydrate kinase n=1 Tax=Acidihalobacter prosperus TaxID=160660 RepID=A0A1A6C8Y8_9GAMM|nr:FGGY-family carbohydrate kinase [Acidihalobacter prosperus]OBS11028.1 carbohydrate kinase [Acidihalobacter prosperus]